MNNIVDDQIHNFQDQHMRQTGYNALKSRIRDYRQDGIIIWILLVLLLFCSQTNAQEVEVSSSLNPVGSGARATGMGGAFIGVADDATAASWNPAGLIQLEKPEISAVYAYFQRQQRYSLHESDADEYLTLQGDNSMDVESLNYASAAFPFVLLGRNMIFSVNYQRMFEMSKDVEFSTQRDIGVGVPIEENVSFDQDGTLYALSPAYAVEITPDLSLGITVNFWDDLAGKNGWVTRYKYNAEYDRVTATSQTHREFHTTQKDKVSFKGINAHVGFLWKINKSLMLGGVYKSPFNADVERERFIDRINITDLTVIIAGNPVNLYTESKYDDDNTQNFIYRMPRSYGLGLSYRHSDSLTVAIDVYRTEWSRFVIRDEDENEKNPLTGDCISTGSEDTTKCPVVRKTRLKDTTQVRAGMEYLFIRQKDVIPVRFGLFYDPEPASGHLDEYYGASFGTGYARGRVALDFAYQFRMGRNLTADVATIGGAETDIKQHLFMASTILYF